MKILINYRSGLACIILLVCTKFGYCQNNGLVRYDAIIRSTDYISSVPIDTTKENNNTSFNTGELGDVAELNLRKSLSHEPGSGFTDIYSAASWFNTSTYPARTAVKLYYYREGNLHELCSGTLIQNNIIVTSAHCIYYYFDETDLERNWVDSILVIPSFDNSTINPAIGRAISTKYYVFQNWYDEIDLNYDMALIELDEPIGNKTGWIGIGYNQQSDFYTNNNFHNFSYPSAIHPFDSSRIYNGNFLFYSYGQLDTVSEFEIGHKVNAIPGQSGSSVIYSDNRIYQVYGVLSNHLYGYGTLFNRMTPSKFYAIKNLLENETALLDSIESNKKENTILIEKIALNHNYKLASPSSPTKVFVGLEQKQKSKKAKKLRKNKRIRK